MLNANLQGKPVNKNKINTPNNMQTTNCNKLFTFKHFLPGKAGLLKKKTNHQPTQNPKPSKKQQTTYSHTKNYKNFIPTGRHLERFHLHLHQAVLQFCSDCL